MTSSLSTLRRILEGNTTVLVATFAYGDPIENPVTATFLVMLEGGGPPTAHTFPGAPEITNPSPGVFNCRLDLPPGQYASRCEVVFADSTHAAADESFEVLPTKVK